jgi:putative redox protein
MPKKNLVYATLSEQNYFTQITGNNHAFYVDEPESGGGKNKAPHPTAYLLASLASCTAITIRMYAQRKDWDVGQIQVSAKKVELLTQEGKRSKIVKQITFGNKDLTEVEIKRLVTIGEKCPISKMLKNETQMEFEVVDQLEEV